MFHLSYTKVHFRFDKSSNELQLMCSAKGNILIFAHIACKSHFISLSHFRLKGNRRMASYAILNFPVILQSSRSDAGTIIIISAGDVITLSGKRREFVPLFPHVQGKSKPTIGGRFLRQIFGGL